MQPAQPKPALELYETLEAYIDAMIDWSIAKRFADVDRVWLKSIGVDPE
jgi:hypothetical protein